MRDRDLSKLQIAYTSFALLYLVVGIWWHSIDSATRASLLLTALATIVILQIAIARHIQAIKYNRLFFLFTILWCFYLMVFVVDEGFGLIWNESPLVFSFINAMSLIVLALLTAVSFLVRKPFWYANARSKTYIIIGAILFIVSSSLGAITVLAIIDHIHG